MEPSTNRMCPFGCRRALVGSEALDYPLLIFGTAMALGQAEAEVEPAAQDIVLVRTSVLEALVHRRGAITDNGAYPRGAG